MNNKGETGGYNSEMAAQMDNARYISEITCLTGQSEDQSGGSARGLNYHPQAGGEWFKDKSADSDEPDNTPRSNFRDTDSQFVRLSKQGGHEGLLKMETGSDESPFVNTNEISSKRDRMSPSSSQPAGVPHAHINVAPGNPIWLGGSGPERGFVPGKRFLKQEYKDSPFALSDDWNRSQSRNPDKI